MSLEFLSTYAIPVIVGICLCVGYIVKNIVPAKKINKFIPLIMGVVGLGLNIWLQANITPDIVLGGLFSGLASTGLYELFKNIIKNKEQTNESK